MLLMPTNNITCLLCCIAIVIYKNAVCNPQKIYYHHYPPKNNFVMIMKTALSIQCGSGRDCNKVGYCDCFCSNSHCAVHILLIWKAGFRRGVHGIHNHPSILPIPTPTLLLPPRLTNLIPLPSSCMWFKGGVHGVSISFWDNFGLFVLDTFQNIFWFLANVFNFYNAPLPFWNDNPGFALAMLFLNILWTVLDFYNITPLLRGNLGSCIML